VSIFAMKSLFFLRTFKGTMPQDLSLQVFFMNRFALVIPIFFANSGKC
jgi:hypothetical protein